MSGRIMVGSHEGVYVVRFSGDVRLTISASFDHYIEKMLGDPEYHSVLVDLSQAIAIDSTSLGVLAKLSIMVQEAGQNMPTLVCGAVDILRILHNMGFDDVFAIVDENYDSDQNLAELPNSSDMDEAEMRQRVIDSHKTLMDLNESNQATFRDLVEALENEQRGVNGTRRVS